MAAMASPTQSNLTRFFKPGVTKVANSPPQTPPAPSGEMTAADRLASIADAGETPPSQPPVPRKRGASKAAPKESAKEAPKAAKRAKVQAADQAEQADQAADGEEEAPCAESQPPAAGVATSALDSLKDLRATLQQSQRCGPGSLPPFIAECFHHYATGGQQYSWPTWLQPEHLRDAEGRRPTDPEYNQCTLLVPDAHAVKAEAGHNTPMLLQYWKLKRTHFDKVALFKVGKFYEIFYYDAFMAQRACGLKWMGAEKKPHVGFPEMAKHEYAKRIVDAGYKCVVVEQVERVAETRERVAEGRKSDGKKEEKVGPACVERDACEVYTQGTLVDPELLGTAGARYMVYLYFEDGRACNGSTAGLNFAACLVDCATSQIQVGHVYDAGDRNALRTLLAQVQPSEVAYSVGNIPAEVLQLLKRLPCRPQLSATRSAVSNGLMAAKDRLQKYRAAHPGLLPEAVESELTTKDIAIMAAAGAMEYLESVLLGQRILPFAIWAPLDNVCAATTSQPEDTKARPTSKRMVLDATALSALEVMESSEGTKGSLLAYLDHCSTPFGHRLFKQWLCAPLCDVAEIRQRQAAVEFLTTRREIAEKLRDGLKKIVKDLDLERVTSRIWSYALQSERHAVMYEDITARRLANFVELLQGYEQCLQLVASAFPPGSEAPGCLLRLVRDQKQGGALPELLPVIASLRNSVVQVDSKGSVVKYRPQAGADAAYDEKCRRIDAIHSQLQQELQRVQNLHGGRAFAYVHRLPGYRFEMECDEQAVTPAFSRGVDVTLRGKGRLRFYTEKSKQLLGELETLENQREDCVFPFLAKLFRRFHEHQAGFRAALRCVAELDVILSLSSASQGLAGCSCLPVFEDLGPDASASLELRGCRHPVAAAKMGNSFVPNDTLLNAAGVPGVLVVTGPNMGGKSTVLRQTCLAVIMAQLGCRVNATYCRLSPIDRIFTRIGSYDMLLEGKSTLLTELEETSAILAHGTRRSLAVLDELGRGTSTFDGAAIAAAVLDDLTRRVGCLVLFATHYHPVSREAAKWTEKVAPFHMAAEVGGSSNEMTFLYRFLPGLCPASHGHHVARLAGLPEKVLREALARSAEFERLDEASQAAEIVKLADCGDIEGLKAMFRHIKQAK